MLFSSTLSMALALVAGGDLKSGPPVGADNDRRGFKPELVAGPSTGQRLCPV
jgi:hypothetical protein